jgi:phage gp36-like protein
MGNYTDRDSVELAAGGLERLTQLTDYDRDGDEDTGVVDAAIGDAEALVDSYARKVFAVPFSPVPPIIKTVSTKIAIYFLRERRDAITDANRLDHEDRLQWLANLAKGAVDPGIEPAPGPSGHNRSTATARPSSKAVSRESLKGYS